MTVPLIDMPWQLAFDLAWESYRKGSIPIGAVIVDEYGKIISTGRNRTLEKTYKNSKMAHAEMDALLNIDVSKHPNLRSYTVYTCMEPCPMCMGSIVMSNIRKVKIAARDTYAGSTHFCEIDPYVSSKNTEIIFESGLLEMVTLVLQSCYELKSSNGQVNNNNILAALSHNNPRSFRIAKKLFFEGRLDEFVNANVNFQEIFDYISSYKITEDY